MKKKFKKLSLTTETLGNLGGPELQHAVGGASEVATVCTVACTACTGQCSYCTAVCTNCTRACSICCL